MNPAGVYHKVAVAHASRGDYAADSAAEHHGREHLLAVDEADPRLLGKEYQVPYQLLALDYQRAGVFILRQGEWRDLAVKRNNRDYVVGRAPALGHLKPREFHCALVKGVLVRQPEPLIAALFINGDAVTLLCELYGRRNSAVTRTGNDYI